MESFGGAGAIDVGPGRRRADQDSECRSAAAEAWGVRREPPSKGEGLHCEGNGMVDPGGGGVAARRAEK